MYRIFVVEDDEIIAKSLASHLEKWNYEVILVNDFSKVAEEFVAAEPHLVLLDIVLPFFNGFHWCTQIRQISDLPILFLSSASDNMNMVMSMNMGADDFVAKPFDLNVLTAKIQALLRRSYSVTQTMNVISHGGLLLNLLDNTLENNGQKTDLTKNEFKILQTLLEQAGRIVSREVLMERLWESDSFVDDNTLTVNMTRLRKKLREIGLPDFVSTKKGLGYIID
ncbi:MAG TPA: response regulator transcription factor [Bacillota bacterium]|nr:response regulator transcription factor [Bacillota bacterium]